MGLEVFQMSTRLFWAFAGATVLLFSPVSLFALNDEVAEITYIEGDVQILRNAKLLSGKDVDFGTAIQNYDQIRSGKNGMVEFVIDKKTGIDATVTVKPGSVITVDITSLKNQQKGAIDLLAGGVQFKVNKLTNGNMLNLRTDGASMGVRGTQFNVDYAVNGDVLLSTSEGRVETTTSAGKTLFSAPGNVVQGSADGDWSSIPVSVEGLEAFRKKWNTERIDAFKVDPARATAQFATRYLNLKSRFDNAYAKMLGNRDLIQKWIREDMAGNIGSTAERLREKRQIFGALRDLRVVMVQFERVYWRLLELDDLYQQGIAASGQIRSGLSVVDFFRQFRNDRNELASRTADIAYVTKLYAKRNEGSFPLDQDLTDLSTDPGQNAQNSNSFFGDTNSFFGNP